MVEGEEIRRRKTNPKDIHPPDLYWWMRQIVLVLLGCFFFIFGILVLISSYRLEEPFSFILTFFSSNFIILISATLVFIFAYRMKPYILRPDRRTRQRDPLDTD